MPDDLCVVIYESIKRGLLITFLYQKIECCDSSFILFYCVHYCVFKKCAHMYVLKIYLVAYPKKQLIFESHSRVMFEKEKQQKREKKVMERIFINSHL